tara:strand:+ start:2317 stop:2556 length:240 start_codon:yes stop_codon:yes gene_type:complete
MSRKCQISGKKPLVGNRVSKSNIKTKRKQFPNLQTKNIFVPELGRKVKIKLSVSSLKTIDKIGLLPYLKKENIKLTDII